MTLNFPTPEDVKHRTLMSVCGETADALKNLLFASISPPHERRVMQLASAAAQLDHAVRRLRMSVLEQPSYPDHQAVLEMVAEMEIRSAAAASALQEINKLIQENPDA